MANPFVDFTFPVTGQTARLSMPDRLAQVTNVIDLGADPTGAVSCTALIQASIDANTTGNYGTYYFPPGVYKVDSPGIKFNRTGDISIRFSGEGRASTITGTHAGFVFERSSNPAPGTLDVGPIVFEYLSIINNTVTGTYGGGCIRVGSVSCVHVRNCNLSAPQGVWFCGETFDASEACLIENCPMRGSGFLLLSSNAVVLGGTGSVQACDFTGFKGTAIRIFGKGASVRDTRLEVNRTAILVGKFPDDTDDTSTGNFTWIGASTESNGLTLDMQNCSGFLCAAAGPGGGTAPYRGSAITGAILLTNITSVGTVTTSTAGINVFGQFTADSKTGTINATDRFTGAGVPTGTFFAEAIVATPVFTYCSQDPQYNMFTSSNVSNGVFAGFSAGSAAWDKSIYISDTADRAGLVFMGCNATSVATALGGLWRIPTTAHTAEFINCTANDGSGPVAQPAPVYLFSGLPTGANVREGDQYNISNAHTATGAWGETVNSSAATTVGDALVRYNGTNWTLEGK